ncbi:MAG: hypothetical protein IPJ19_20415 [Planctomycetes bacterium]|nr:hypothetical protein [Planctomycetota bacterium]
MRELSCHEQMRRTPKVDGSDFEHRVIESLTAHEPPTAAGPVHDTSIDSGKKLIACTDVRNGEAPGGRSEEAGKRLPAHALRKHNLLSKQEGE